MIKQRLLLTQSFLLVLVCSFVPSSWAVTVDDLIAQNKLSVELRLISPEPIIAKQAVIFEVEVATQSRFAKGTYLVNPSLNNAVLLPPSKLGTNSSKVVGGETWVSQIREITLYPSDAGAYQLPPVEVSVSVNLAPAGVPADSVEGSIFTQPLNFQVTIPEDLKGYDNYIVSPDVSLTVNDNSEDGFHYSVGDAISQTVTIKAHGVPAMMLPVLNIPAVDGLGVYHQPPELNDQSSRGELWGTRTEKLSYIFEQAGNYKIPEQIIYWWNIDTQELSQLTIPAQQWQVKGGGLVGSATKLSRGVAATSVLPYIVFFIVAGAISWLCYKLYLLRRQLWSYYAELTQLPYRQKRKAFIQAVKQGQYIKACDLLYQVLSYRKNIGTLQEYYAGNEQQLAALEQLSAAAYFNKGDAQSFSVEMAELLLKKTSAKPVFQQDSLLQLNPKS